MTVNIVVFTVIFNSIFETLRIREKAYIKKKL